MVDPCINYRADATQFPLRRGSDCFHGHNLSVVTFEELIKIRDGWRPSIHMPRWASRITLEVADVRVQRVQEISEEDAGAEGITGDEALVGQIANPYRAAFADFWDSINAPRGFGWDVNPWIWAITFRRILEAER